MPPKLIGKNLPKSLDASVFSKKSIEQSMESDHDQSSVLDRSDMHAVSSVSVSNNAFIDINETEIDRACADLGFTKSFRESEMPEYVKKAHIRKKDSRKMQVVLSSVSKKEFKKEAISEETFHSFVSTIMSIDITEMSALSDNALLDKYELYVGKVFSNIPAIDNVLEEGIAQGWLGDNELAFRARLNTIKDLSRLYEAKAMLLTNRYYVLLGDKGYEDETRDSLLIKLKKEYLKKNPNTAKIDYYQNVIRVMDSTDLTKKGIAKREEKHLKRLQDKEKQKADRDKYDEQVQKAREKLEQPFVRKTDDITDAVRRAMKINVFAEQISDDAVTDHVNKEQQGGIDIVMSWFLSVCNEGSRSYESFVLKLLKYPKRQQLAALYLIEKDKLESATRMDVYAAQAFYVPDLQKIKSKLVPGKLGRFIRRLRKGSSYDWDKVSTAFEAASKSKTDLAEYDQMVSGAEETELHALGSERHKNLIDLSMQKSQILMAHMQSFGITPDMPIDMIEDAEIREKLQQEYRENVSILKEISEICRSDGADPSDMLLQLFQKKPKEMKDDAYGQGITSLDSVGDAMDVVSFIADRTYDVMNLMDHVKEAKYVDGVSGIIGGTADFFHTIFSLRKMYETVYDKTMAEEEQGTDIMSHAGKAVRLFGNVGRQYTFATRAFLNLSEATNNLIYSVSGGLFGAGSLVMAVASGKKVKDSKANISRLSEAEKTLLEVPKEELTNEDKTLGVFMTHRKDALSREKRTAAIDSAISFTSAVGGALMVNPATVSVGGIVKTVADIAKPLFSDLPDYVSKKRERLRLIDDYLCLDKLVEDVKINHPNIPEAKLREAVRTEAMAQLGFNGKEAMHRHIAGTMADIIYRNAYKKPDGSYYTQSEYESDQKRKVKSPEIAKRNSYLGAVRSLGLKISLPDAAGVAPLVTPGLLTAKIMG